MSSSAPYVKGSATSKAAAKALVNPNTKRAAVLRFIESRGYNGATDDEIQIGLGISPSTERPRRIELFEARKIAKTSYIRRTRTGRAAAVYVSVNCIEPGLQVELAPIEKPCCAACGRPF